MISYDVQNALTQKADKFEIHNLQQDNQLLKDEVRDLAGKLTRLSNENNGLREVLMRLIDNLSERKDFNDIFNQLQNLRMLL